MIKLNISLDKNEKHYIFVALIPSSISNQGVIYEENNEWQ